MTVDNMTLEDLLDEIGVEDINPRGDEVHARCPMHEERTGTRELRPRHWSINRSTGLHHCFSCGYRGSLLTLVMDVTKRGMWDAQRYIRTYGLDFSGLATLERNPHQVDREPVLDLSERLEVFCTPPSEALAQRRLSRHSVERYGLRWDRGEEAWVLPIRSPDGAVWGFQTKSATRVLNHPPGCRKSKTLFGLDLAIESQFTEYIILVESPLDVVYLDELGWASVASFGAAVSDEQLRLTVSQFQCIVLALDNDRAGKDETKRILATHWARQRPFEVLNYDKVAGKDPGEMSEDEMTTAMETATMSVFWEGV
jgi:DNA primase